MMKIRAKIVRDDNDIPVSVEIPYEDWMRIRAKLDVEEEKPRRVDYGHLEGSLKLTEDPVEFQRRIRSEWS